MIAFDELRLKRLSTEYVSYYREDSIHLGLSKETSGWRATVIRTECSRVVSRPLGQTAPSLGSRGVNWSCPAFPCLRKSFQKKFSPRNRLKEKSAHQVRTQIAFIAEETHSIQLCPRIRCKHVRPRPNGSTEPRRTPPPHSLLSENAHPLQSLRLLGIVAFVRSQFLTKEPAW